jgi:coenzyme PQQ precursor peptide PqqA
VVVIGRLPHIFSKRRVVLIRCCSLRNRTVEEIMKTWKRPEVREQEVGLEVTSYLPAEIDII